MQMKWLLWHGFFAVATNSAAVHNPQGFLLSRAVEHSDASGDVSQSGDGHFNASGWNGPKWAGSVPLDIDCFEPFLAPGKKYRCPDKCPYMRFDPERMCHFKCITKSWCQSAPGFPTMFPDEADGRCILCNVAGCDKCASAHQCAENHCQEGFNWRSGQCTPPSQRRWYCVYAVLILCALFCLLYIVALWRRPCQNTILLSIAQKYRSFSKLRSDEAGHPFYPLTIPLYKVFVSGVGIVLHFRYQLFWLIWAFAVMVGSACISWRYDRFQAAEVMALSPQHEEAFSACRHFTEKDQNMVVEMQTDFTVFTFLVYVVTFLACLVFAIWQKRTFRKMEDEAVTMADYAIRVQGMPTEDATDTLEDDYTKFFRNAWGPSVLGVSICWDFIDKKDAVREMASHVVHKVDNKYLSQEDLELMREEEKTRNRIGEDEKRDCFLDPEMRCIDNIFWGQPCITAAREDTGSANPANSPPSPLGTGEEELRMHAVTTDNVSKGGMRVLLESLKTTGSLFVIVETEIDAVRIMKSPPVQYVEGTTLALARERMEPETVLWTGFSVNDWFRRWYIFGGIIFLAFVIVAWAALFYGPYVYYVLSWSSVAGASTGNILVFSLLGFLAIPGNQIVYHVCQLIAENACFKGVGGQVCFNVVLYTIAVFVNCVVDLGLLLVLAHGFQQDSGLDASAAIRNPSLQHSLFLQMVGYLYPGTLLFPYLFEPIAINIGPYFLGTWLIRSATQIKRHDAERCLACPQFDLLRYGDIAINVMLVIVCFFLTAQALWWVFMWLFISHAIIYAWDQYRFLRQCQRTWFVSDLMEHCSQYTSMFPCALLAAASVFKWYGGFEVLHSFDDSRKTHEVDFYKDINQNVWSAMGFAFFAHVLVHTLLLTFLVPLFVPYCSPGDTPYSEAAKMHACNWWNSNPVHCVRSFAVHDTFGGPPHVFYVPGKEYVHKVNPKMNQHYEQPDFMGERKWSSGIGHGWSTVKGVLHFTTAHRPSDSHGNASHSHDVDNRAASSSEAIYHHTPRI